MPAPNYNIYEYRNLREPITQETGHTLLRNNKHYKGRNGIILLAGLHIAVVADDTILPDSSAENLNQYGATTSRTASWHVGTDTDSICAGLPDNYTAWVQGVTGYDFNSHGLGAEIATLRTDWRKIPEWRQYRFLRMAAAWWAPRVMKYKIPLVLIRNREEVQRRIRAKTPVGFAYHGDLDPTNRTDPGLVNPGRVDTFPIEWFFELVEDEINLRLKKHGDVYKYGKRYKPYNYGSRTLRIFCEGEDVLHLQKSFNALGYKVSEDSSFGPDMEAKTLKFQADNKLVEDGLFGPACRTALEKLLEKKDTAPKPKPKPVPPALGSISITRVSGSSRYATNIALVRQKGKGGARKVYVVNGDTPDALVASSLGDGVVFLSGPTALPSSVLKEIVAYKPSSVVVAGGPTSVPDTVIRQLKA